MEISELIIEPIGKPMRHARSKSPEELKAWREERMRKAIEEDRRELDQKLSEYLRNQLGKRFRDRTFDTFAVDESNRYAYEVCRKYAERENFDDGKGILLSGTYGTGKTHLMASITNRLLERGIPCLFNTFNGHITSLMEEFNSGEPRRHMNLMKRIPVLVIDDVGKEKQSEWSQSVMYEVINSRYENNKPILITTNHSHRELMKYFGGAVYSRLNEVCYPLTLQGKDRRSW